jgi:hypothetical protein
LARSNNVTRKNKIRIAVAVVVAGALAITFWPRESAVALRITLTGGQSNRADSVFFTITNTSKAEMIYGISAEVQSNLVWTRPQSLSTCEGDVLNGQDSKTFGVKVDWTNRWRLGLDYFHPVDRTKTYLGRVGLASYAFDRGWTRMGQWLSPTTPDRTTYGPEMLGNKPAPPTSK